MNLFNYLMNKNDKEIVDNNHLLEYLLNAGKLTSITGTELNIIAKKRKINELIMTKESTQEGSPTPENPVEVNTVKGYRNLLDINDSESGGIDSTGNLIDNSYSWRATDFIEVKPNQKYTFINNEGLLIRFYQYDTSKNFISPRIESAISNKEFTITTGATTKYLKWTIYNTNSITLTKTIVENYDLQITESNGKLPYVPYGTNWIYTKVSNGTDTNYYTIPLNGNEIAGIGDYKDELIVDSKGKCWLNKKIGKAILDGSENWTDRPNYTYGDRFVFESTIIPMQIVNGFSNYFITTNYLSVNYPRLILNNGQQIVINFSDKGTTTLSQFKTWLSTHNTDVYYVLATEQLIDLNYTTDIRLFKGVNNITNSDDMTMVLKYYS